MRSREEKREYDRKRRNDPVIGERLRAYQTEYRSRPGGLEQRRRANYKRILRINYGMTPEDFATMQQQQDGKCGLCDAQLLPGYMTHVDHDHASGKVRTLLCHNCNVGLGLFRDSPELLRRAAEYIEEHQP